MQATYTVTMKRGTVVNEIGAWTMEQAEQIAAEHRGTGYWTTIEIK